GIPEPRSMNWSMPDPAASRTARCRNARLARIISGSLGSTAMACSTAARSEAKLWVPPRKQSYIRAGLGRSGSKPRGGRGTSSVMPPPSRTSAMIGTTSRKLLPQAGPETTTSGKLCRSSGGSDATRQHLGGGEPVGPAGAIRREVHPAGADHGPAHLPHERVGTGLQQGPERLGHPPVAVRVANDDDQRPADRRRQGRLAEAYRVGDLGGGQPHGRRARQQATERLGHSPRRL